MTISVRGCICRMDVTKLATNASIRMMALVIKNSPMNERHICISSALFITASTSPRVLPSPSVMGTPATNCFFSYTPTVLRPSYSWSPPSTVWVISAGMVMLLPPRSLSVVSSTLPSTSQIRKSTSVIREATPARVRSASSWSRSASSAAVKYPTDSCATSTARSRISCRFSDTV